MCAAIAQYTAACSLMAPQPAVIWLGCLSCIIITKAMPTDTCSAMHTACMQQSGLGLWSICHASLQGKVILVTQPLCMCTVSKGHGGLFVEIWQVFLFEQNEPCKLDQNSLQHETRVVCKSMHPAHCPIAGITCVDRHSATGCEAGNAAEVLIPTTTSYHSQYALQRQICCYLEA